MAYPRFEFGGVWESGAQAIRRAKKAAKFTDEQVLEIRRARGVTNKKLAEIYGVSAGVVSRIRLRTSYAWVKEEE